MPITVEFVLEKLEGILNNADVSTKDKLVAIRMCGEYLKMFDKQQRLQIDIRSLITRLGDNDLKRISSTRGAIEISEYNPGDCFSDDKSVCRGLQLPENREHGTTYSAVGDGGLCSVPGNDERDAD